MPLLIGILLALAISVMATLVGFDRDRSFYPTVTMVVGSYYALFAAMGGSPNALAIESVVGLLFVAAAIVGFKTDLRVVAVALSGHGLFDFVHARWITNPGMPTWWPMFCGGYDVLAGAYLAVLLARRGLDFRRGRGRQVV
jgi:hypothetical protein